MECWNYSQVCLTERGRFYRYPSPEFFYRQPRADEFGDYLLTAEVPLSKVFYYTRLLPDMLKGEEEYVVIGGLYEVSIASY